MEKSLVSVIVPCYNGEQFIDRSLCSIYEQDYEKIEVIVVDDGSNDHSKDKILAWSRKFEIAHKGLKYIYQQNKGLSGAINTGLKYIEGEFLSLLDADDEYLPGCIKERVHFLECSPNIHVVRSNGYIVKENKKLLFVQDAEKGEQNIFKSLLRGETNNWAGGYMVRTTPLFRFYPNREIYQSRFGQNLQFLLPLTYKKDCGYIDHLHMNYIQQTQSLSQTEDEREKKKNLLINAEGYLDIRVHMLDEVVLDENEKKALLPEIYECYWRSVMRIADYSHDPQLMKSAYQNLKKYKTPDINDKILYFGVCQKLLWLIYRVMRKCGYGR